MSKYELCFQSGLKRTGYDEVALTSLSTADYSGIKDVVEETIADPVNCGQVSISLPSLRVDVFTVDIAASIQNARRTGLTFAPEAGTWRVRQVINKLIRKKICMERLNRDSHRVGKNEALLPYRVTNRN
ncbi:MAG: hypothetical protein Ct9H90mP11_06870 [Acidimicrobiales bacterium]|nr:MAG: hypothetical protein Ct9H90mP11_06870 [Acidimicrobiales bacterium]